MRVAIIPRYQYRRENVEFNRLKIRRKRQKIIKYNNNNEVR